MEELKQVSEKLIGIFFSKYPGTLEAYQRGYETIRPLIDLQKVLPLLSFY